MDINETLREKSSFKKDLFSFLIFGILGVVFYYQYYLQISNYSEYEIAAKKNKNMKFRSTLKRNHIW